MHIMYYLSYHVLYVSQLLGCQYTVHFFARPLYGVYETCKVMYTVHRALYLDSRGSLQVYLDLVVLVE